MGIIEVVIVSVALALDAFAVAISCGIKLQHWRPRTFLKISLSFAIFQGVMPLLGWSAGHLLKGRFEAYAGYICAVVFFFLGAKTIFDVHSSKQDQCGRSCQCNCDNPYCLLSLAVATSIDALLVGVVFSLLGVRLFQAVTIIAFTTLVISFLGLLIGLRTGKLVGKKASIIAGLILIGMAIKAFIN